MVEADLDVLSVMAAKDSQLEGSQGWGHKDNALNHVCGLLEIVYLLSIPPCLSRGFFCLFVLFPNFINFLLHLFTCMCACQYGGR